ncbi:YicC/YloC family endoribonuclease [Azospirillum agricola]|uniref:YicC/YloC family endoribonuclease n=1 Tax=Azospirillum agricola TaxID=1720247 RepID=UPI000A0F1EA2|nr:YicC/YloC family endoribonuclease [Azospirillum agricola]SMH60210.1 TIGR00255 family protein [Azospirillum lipoferum]
MTGFARVDGHGDGFSWTFEAKSVNGRSLDLRCRLPSGFDGVEAVARAEVPKKLARGNVNLTLTVNRSQAVSQLRINRELLAQVLELAREIEGAGAAPPRLDSLLAVRGIIEPVEEDETEARERVESALKADLAKLIDQLAVNRLAEGARLAAVLNGHLDEIARLVEAAGACASTQPEALREKLRTQVATILGSFPALSEERLAQEAAILIGKADVREEMDRLRAHIQAARDMMTEGGAIGRRFDFLCQEFNREANTLCSKSADVELTRIGLSLKASIEQLREQVQNIE